MKRRTNRLQRAENIYGWSFVAPVLTIFIVLTAFPFFFSIFLSFTKWNFLGGWEKLKWIGLDNFKEIIGDRRFRSALINTAVYTVVSVPVSISLSLVLAYVMNGKIFMKKVLRMAYFIPYISAIVALGAVFKFLFREDGIVNGALLALNIVDKPLNFNTNADVSKIPIIMLVIWTAIGYELIIYMAAIQNVPKSLYEAATIDGATGFKQFVHITFPLISPTTFYLVVVRMMGTFKIFAPVNIFTLGTTVNSNTSMVSEIYEAAFVKYRFGYASAQAMVLFAIILIITGIQFWGQKKWVHY